MDYILTVDVLEGVAHLKNIIGRQWLWVFTDCFQGFVELTIVTVLQDQVDLLIIVEEAIELHNVLMSQVALDFNLTP